MATTIPSPADAPSMSASELLDYIRSRGGRVFRFCRPPVVFVLTTDPELAAWLVKNKGRSHTPVGMGVAEDGSYRRAEGIREWDVVISPMPVTDEVEVGVGEPAHAIWKAAA